MTDNTKVINVRFWMLYLNINSDILLTDNTISKTKTSGASL